eukprot:985201-Prorocentrum_minimum.AAC.1
MYWLPLVSPIGRQPKRNLPPRVPVTTSRGGIQVACLQPRSVAYGVWRILDRHPPYCHLPLAVPPLGALRPCHPYARIVAPCV